MKRVLAIFLAVIMVVSVVPVTTYAAEQITLSIIPDKTELSLGDTVSFTVSLGTVSNMGGLEFNLIIPDGMTIIDDSISIPDGIETTLDAAMNVVKPTSANHYKWGFFAGRTGYTGTSELTLLTFSCKVNADTSQGSKSVTLKVETCFDNDTNLFDTNVVSAEIAIGNESICAHVLSKVDAVPATCERGGNIEYYVCSQCGKMFTDAEGNNEITETVVKATGHTEGNTWVTDDNNHWKVCTVCSGVLDQAAHGFTWVVDKAPTESKTGVKHEECVCGMKRNENTVIPKLVHAHTGIQHHEAVAATCQAAGNMEYWTCSDPECSGIYYGDSACQNIITDIAIPINPNNHVGERMWDVDTEKHIQVCACGVVISEGSHIYDDGEDGDCNVCGYRRYYTVTDGAEAAYEKSSGGNLAFKVDGDFSLFSYMQVDGITVDKANYSVAQGSTIINLNAGYLNTLADGTHELTAFYTDGKSARTKFSVVQRENGDNEFGTGNEGGNDDSSTSTGSDTESNGGTGAVENQGGQASTNQPEASQEQPGAGEPKTGDASIPVATLAMIGGMSYLADLFLNKRNVLGMSETQKNMLVHRIVEWARGRNMLVRWLAVMAIVVILAYYHSIGKKCGEQMNELAQLI